MAICERCEKEVPDDEIETCGCCGLEVCPACLNDDWCWDCDPVQRGEREEGP